MKIDPDEIYTPTEVAAILKCGKTNCYDLISNLKLRAICVGSGGKGLRILGSDLLAFLEAQRSGGLKPQTTFKRLGL